MEDGPVRGDPRVNQRSAVAAAHGRPLMMDDRAPIADEVGATSSRSEVRKKPALLNMSRRATASVAAPVFARLYVWKAASVMNASRRRMRYRRTSSSAWLGRARSPAGATPCRCHQQHRRRSRTHDDGSRQREAHDAPASSAARCRVKRGPHGLLLTANWPALERIGLDYPRANRYGDGDGRLQRQRWLVCA